MDIQFLQWLERTSLRATLLAVMVLLTQWVFRQRLSARWRYNLWLLAVTGFVLPFSFQSSLSVLNVFRYYAPIQATPSREARIESPSPSASAAFVANGAAIENRKPSETVPKKALAALPENAALPPAKPNSPLKYRWPNWSVERGLLLVWIGGAACLAFAAIAAERRFARRLRSGKRISDDATMDLFRQCKEEMNVARSVALLSTDAVTTPAVYGFFHCRLLLPSGLTESMSREQLRFIFMHELAHVRQWDIAANWLVRCLQVVHWFNPAAWLVFRRMRKECEIACDAVVLSHTNAARRKAYGETILLLLEGVGREAAPPGLLGILEDNYRGLTERIDLIARYRPASRRSTWALLLVFALGLCGLTDAQTRELIPQLSAQLPATASEGSDLQQELVLPMQGDAADQRQPHPATPNANAWRQLAAAPAALEGRSGNSAVWTGSQLIVFGGEGMGTGFADGARYDLLQNTWAMLPSEGEPSMRSQHTAVWTGREMIVWGGFGGVSGINTNRSDGARYNPADNSWKPMTTKDAPTARFQHTAVWTGREMLVWGGYTDSVSIYHGAYDDAYLNSGGRYDPVSDTWQEISTHGAPTKRFNHVSLWTGDKMLVWGGNDETKALNDGGIYDPQTDTWKPITTFGAPSPRKQPLAVWTGKEMIVWGGSPRDDSKCFEDGARYDPVTDHWASISNVGAPRGRVSANAVWTGTEMVFWGGVNDQLQVGVPNQYPAPEIKLMDGGNTAVVWDRIAAGRPQANGGRYLSTGGCYNPATDTWSTISSSGLPSARLTSAVWDGDALLIFGGDNGAHLNDAYIYSW